MGDRPNACLPFFMKKTALIILSALISLISFAQELAFPGAEGFGKYTTGGRGGKVWIVTNVNDNGPGSLREAVEAEGPRIVVFEVDGDIHLETPLRIENDNITIAGQSAPGDGICLCDSPVVINASNVIVRYIRCRLGDKYVQDADALSGGRYGQKNDKITVIFRARGKGKLNFRVLRKNRAQTISNMEINSDNWKDYKFTFQRPGDKSEEQHLIVWPSVKGDGYIDMDDIYLR